MPPARPGGRPGDDCDDPDQDTRRQGIPCAFEQQTAHPRALRRQRHGRPAGRFTAQLGVHGEHRHDAQDDGPDPVGQPDGGGQRRQSGGPRTPQMLRYGCQDPALGRGRGQGVGGEGEPGTDEPLAGAVVRAGGAPARQHHARPEQEGAEHRRNDGQARDFRSDHAQSGQKRDAESLDGDREQEGDEPAWGVRDPQVPERAGDAETSALEDEAECGPDEKSGKEHEWSCSGH